MIDRILSFLYSILSPELFFVMIPGAIGVGLAAFWGIPWLAKKLFSIRDNYQTEL